MWNREGLIYTTRFIIRVDDRKKKVTRKLDFIAYHLIKLFHGQEKLEKLRVL